MAREPGPAEQTLKSPRWVYEKGAPQKAAEARVNKVAAASAPVPGNRLADLPWKQGHLLIYRVPYLADSQCVAL